MSNTIAQQIMQGGDRTITVLLQQVKTLEAEKNRAEIILRGIYRLSYHNASSLAIRKLIDASRLLDEKKEPTS